MKSIIISIIVAVILIGGAVVLSAGGSQDAVVPPVNNVSIVGEKQIIEIHAKGGYQPKKSTAKAGVPTVLRFDTNGTFDCSSAVIVPSLGISKILPQTGTTDIDIGIAKAGTLKGMCGMGMYPFEVDFQS